MTSPAYIPIRIARPVADLARAERFWVDGVGLGVLWRTQDDELGPGDHRLVMVGWPGAAWHLELVDDPGSAGSSLPSEEDLLVIYLGSAIEPSLEDRLTAAGGRRVTSRNPYWDRWGVTFVDPDGYRLVLSHRTWQPRAPEHPPPR